MDYFVFAQIVKTRGLRGCVKAISFLESQDALDRLDVIDVRSKTGQTTPHRIKKIDFVGKFLFLEFEDITHVDAALPLVGSELLMPRELLGELDEDEYYWQDLIGLNVYCAEGSCLGKIASIFPTGSNDVFVCRGAQKEILIPAVADVIERIDLQERILIVKNLEGLMS